MKTLFRYLPVLLLVAALPFGLLSCEDESTQLCPGVEFDIDVFVEEVSKRMNDPANPVSGYQFVVSRNGNLYHDEAGGVSVHANDPNGPIAMTVDTRMNVASVSKFIGTIALMQVLEKEGISLQANVIDYLPPSFQAAAHPDFSDIGKQAYLTFEKLLTMETAIVFPGSTPPSGDMQTEAQMLQGLSNRPDVNREGTYQNGNFTLIRVLIGELVYDLPDTTADYSTACTDRYFEYIKENIFDPLGIYPPMSAQSVDLYYDVTVYTLGYRFPFDENWTHPDDGTLGWVHYSNPYRNGGSGGLILSSMDIARVAAFFRHDPNETIISETQRDRILELELGLTESISNTAGTQRFQSKGGTRGPENEPGRRALYSNLMFFPNGIETVLMTNCRLSTLRTILRDSYEAAFVNPC